MTERSSSPHAVRLFQNADADTAARLAAEGMRSPWTSTPEQCRQSLDATRLRLVAEDEGEVVVTAPLSPGGSAPRPDWGIEGL
ncbi:MAG: hypothetical protein AB1511_11335, partial [Deinococcota bacterium]